MKVTSIQFNIAATNADFEAGRRLFTAYIDALGLDLSFQNVEAELKDIQLQYGPPEGALILGFYKKQAIACVGIRKWVPRVAELKRMYVLPEYRGLKLGKLLMEEAVKQAVGLGYHKILLDTMRSMQAAIRLYHSAGFKEITAYRFNPYEGAVYMEKVLS